MVAACTSGDGGLATGGGQDPDPATLDFKIAYVKRPVPEEGVDVATDVRRLVQFEPGGDLYVRDNASPSAIEGEALAAEHARLRPLMPARLNHYMTQSSLTKALEWLDHGE